MTGRQLRTLRRLRGAERARIARIVQGYHRMVIRGVEPADVARYRETTYADLRQIAKSQCRDLHCWEDGPRDPETWVGSTCMLVVRRGGGHSGAHRWLSDARFGVTFAALPEEA